LVGKLAPKVRGFELGKLMAETRKAISISVTEPVTGSHCKKWVLARRPFGLKETIQAIFDTDCSPSPKKSLSNGKE
jgi:hypothetical protein